MQLAGYLYDIIYGGLPVIFWLVLGVETWVITAPWVIATPRTLVVMMRKNETSASPKKSAVVSMHATGLDIQRAPFSRR
jgi:hypothetical protein